MEEHVMEHSMHWTEAWLRTRTGRFRLETLRRLAGHRQRASIISEEQGSIISEEAVMVGVVATIGLGAVVAFMTGLGEVLRKALEGITRQAGQ
jgi:hypothetical protein